MPLLRFNKKFQLTTGIRRYLTSHGIDKAANDTSSVIDVNVFNKHFYNPPTLDISETSSTLNYLSSLPLPQCTNFLLPRLQGLT